MSGSAVKAGRAFVEVFLKDQVSAQLRGLSTRMRAMSGVFARMGSGFVAAGAAIAAPLAAATTVFAASGDAIHKMSLRTGISAESLSKLSFAAEQSGSSLAGVEKGVRGMQRTLLDLASGTGAAVDAYKDIGLAQADLAGLSPEEQFLRVTNALSKIEDPSQRAALAMKIMGKAGTEMLPMLADGAQGIEALMQQAADLGLVIDTKAAASAARLTDSMNALSKSVKGAVLQSVAALAPIIADIADRLTVVVVGIGKWVSENRGLAVAAASVSAGLVGIGGALLGVSSLLYAGSVAFGILGSAAGAVAAIFSPVGLAVAAIAAAVGVAAVYVGTLAAVFWKLADPLTALMPLATSVKNAFVAIGGALAVGDFSGAFEAAAASIQSIMFAAARGVIDIVRNMLTNVIGLVSGVSSGVEGSMSTIGGTVSRVFNEVYQAGKVALGALGLLAADVFAQSPQIIGYAFGLAIKKVTAAVLKLNQWMGQVFLGFVNTLFKTTTNLGPSLIRAMLTGDTSAAMNSFGLALKKSLAAQTLAAGGLAAGLFGGEMPEFKMSPETVAAYEKMAAAAKATSEAGAANQGGSGAPGPTDSDVEPEATPDKLTMPESQMEQYLSRLTELREAFAAGNISADEFAAGLVDLKRSAIGIDATPVEQYRERLALLTQAVGDGTINWQEWLSAVADSGAEIFGLASTRLDDFRGRVDVLSQAMAEGAIGKAEFDSAMLSAQGEFLELPIDPIERYKEKLAELKAALDGGLITEDQFVSASVDALPDRVKQLVDEIRTPLERYKASIAEIGSLHDEGLIDDEVFGRKWDQLKEQLADAQNSGNKVSMPDISGTFSSAAALMMQYQGGSGSAEQRTAALMEESVKQRERLVRDTAAMLRELEHFGAVG